MCDNLPGSWISLKHHVAIMKEYQDALEASNKRNAHLVAKVIEMKKQAREVKK